MSETEQKPVEEPEGVPEPSEAPETPAEEQPTEQEREEERSRAAKRVTFALARATRAEQKNADLEARLAALERGQQPYQPPVDPAVQQAIQAEARRIAAEELAKERVSRFHAAGSATYPDWQQRCSDLQAMGADAQIADLLVRLDDGPKVAAALRDAPEEIERIASLHGEQARAIALGQFVARLEARPARNVSRAPAPPKPISGRASPQYNTYQETDTNKLAEYYAQQAMEQRRRG